VGGIEGVGSIGSDVCGIDGDVSLYHIRGDAVVASRNVVADVDSVG
jgi:hypothetical protein